MLYLMTPYTSPSEEKRCASALLADIAAGALMRKYPHTWVFSPITQGHRIAPTLPKHVAGEHGFWMRHCRHALGQASRAVLLPISGWSTSMGVMDETCQAMTLSIPLSVIRVRKFPINVRNYLTWERPVGASTALDWMIDLEHDANNPDYLESILPLLPAAPWMFHILDL